MATKDDVFVNQKGVLLELDSELSVEDLARVVTGYILYRKPNGQTGRLPATFEGNVLTYLTVGGELDQSGPWIFQAHVVGDDIDAYGTFAQMEVKKHLIAPIV